MALWAFALGYLISSLIQVLVTRSRMQKMMGTAGLKSIALGTFFGFISSSCSFAALSTTRALFQKGAGFLPAMAFMLSSTNLVIELGIVIAIFLSWQFVVGEYVGGLLLILFAWLFVTIFTPKKIISIARQRLDDNRDDESQESTEWRKKNHQLARMAGNRPDLCYGVEYGLERRTYWFYGCRDYIRLYFRKLFQDALHRIRRGTGG